MTSTPFIRCVSTKQVIQNVVQKCSQERNSSKKLEHFSDKKIFVDIEKQWKSQDTSDSCFSDRCLVSDVHHIIAEVS